MLIFLREEKALSTPKAMYSSSLREMASGSDLPPKNGTRYNIVKGGIHGQERVQSGTDH
jgi:hypothetical protein